MKTIAVIINPVSGGGYGLKLWRSINPKLNDYFKKVDYHISEKDDDITSISADFIKKKPECFLILGGDGTLNQAINGLIDKDRLINPDVRIAVLNTGSGGDFLRQFSFSRDDFIQRLVKGQSVETNIGKMIFSDESARYFINESSCGFSGYVARMTFSGSKVKKWGGRLHYLLFSLISFFKYSSFNVNISIDDKPVKKVNLLLLAACNGQYFGGGMHVAPKAKPNDDLLDLVIFKDFTKFNAMLKMSKVYSGKHVLEPNIDYVQAKKIKIAPCEGHTLYLEADGEFLGSGSIEISLIKDKLRLIV